MRDMTMPDIGILRDYPLRAPFREGLSVKRTWMLLCGTCLILAIARPARADGVIRDGLGARSSGRGGTNIAFADNGQVLYDNPAGIVNTSGSNLFDLGVDVLFTDLQFSDPPRNRLTSAWHNPFPIPEASYIRKSNDDQWALGLGVFAPAGFTADYDINGPPALPGIRHYKSLGAMGKLLPGIACRVSDRLSIGGTLGMGLGHTELEGPYFLQSPGPFQGTPTMMRLYTTGVALTWTAGLQYQLSEATTVGVAYQSETRFRQDGVARVDVPLLGQSSFDARLGMVWPRSVGLGIRHELCPHRIVSADVIWFNWSQAFDQFDLRLAEASNPVFAALMGPTLAERFPLDWRDSVSVRVGYERRISRDRTIRLGYAYHPDQIPNRTLTPYIQAILEHAFTVGYGWTANQWEIDIAYQYSFGPERIVTVSDLVGGDFNFSQHRAQAHLAFVSFQRRF
jgi:long-chain fatty acid transport protein